MITTRELRRQVGTEASGAGTGVGPSVGLQVGRLPFPRGLGYPSESTLVAVVESEPLLSRRNRPSPSPRVLTQGQVISTKVPVSTRRGNNSLSESPSPYEPKLEVETRKGRREESRSQKVNTLPLPLSWVEYPERSSETQRPSVPVRTRGRTST